MLQMKEVITPSLGVSAGLALPKESHKLGAVAKMSSMQKIPWGQSLELHRVGIIPRTLVQQEMPQSGAGSLKKHMMHCSFQTTFSPQMARNQQLIKKDTNPVLPRAEENPGSEVSRFGWCPNSQSTHLQSSFGDRSARQRAGSVVKASESDTVLDNAVNFAFRSNPEKVACAPRSQPRWGSSLNYDRIITSMHSNTGWPASFFGDIREEKKAEKDEAVSRALRVVQFLEEHKVLLQVRDLAPQDGELSVLLRPRRPGTMLRHCRMFERFVSFVLSDPESIPLPLEINANLVLRWINHLIDHKVGAYTPSAALGCLRFFAELLGFVSGAGNRAILNRVMEHRDEVHITPSQASPFGVDVLKWLEEMVLDENQLLADRAVCGRWRLMAQASVRHDDLRRTPVGRCRWIISKDGSLRGLWAQAKETKTFARSWICSTGSVTKTDHKDWLPVLMKMIHLSHGPKLMEDDHFGKRAYPDRSGFDVGPIDGQADTLHVRFLMLQENQKRMECGVPERFTFNDIQKIRHHGAKCTFTSCAQYLQHKGFKNVSKAAVRNQGGWRAKGEDSMPDRYLRAKQLMSLELQEICLDYIRRYGELDYEENWLPIAQDDLPEVVAVDSPVSFDFSKEGLASPSPSQGKSIPSPEEEIESVPGEDPKEGTD